MFCKSGPVAKVLRQKYRSRSQSRRRRFGLLEQCYWANGWIFNTSIFSQLWKHVVKVENVRRGNSIFSVPRPRRRGPSDADASEYSMPHLPVFFSICTCVILMIRSRCCEPATNNYRHLFYTDVVIWSYTLLKIYSLSPYSHTYYKCKKT